MTIQQQNSSTVPSNAVIGTNPAAGSIVPQGSMITLLVSSGPQQTSVPAGLPGQSVATVKSALNALGLKVAVNPSNAQDTWTVDSVTGANNTNLGNGGTVNAGSTVTITAQQPNNPSRPATPDSGSGSSSNAGSTASGSSTGSSPSAKTPASNQSSTTNSQ